MATTTSVRDIMTADPLTFRASDDVRSAMSALVEAGIDGAPVLDDEGNVVGVLTTGDLIVKESRLHFPTVISILGASLELKPKGFEESLEKALGATVGEVMTGPAVTCEVSATVQDAATLMHDERVSRLPVLEAGRLVGIVSRGDVLRGMLLEG